MDVEKLKKLTVLQSLESIKSYLELCAKLGNDLMSEDSEAQTCAIIAAKVIGLFLTEDYGFKAWAEALNIECDKILKEFKGQENLH